MFSIVTTQLDDYPNRGAHEITIKIRYTTRDAFNANINGLRKIRETADQLNKIVDDINKDLKEDY